MLVISGGGSLVYGAHEFSHLFGCKPCDGKVVGSNIYSVAVCGLSFTSSKGSSADPEGEFTGLFKTVIELCCHLFCGSYPHDKYAFSVGRFNSVYAYRM